MKAGRPGFVAPPAGDEIIAHHSNKINNPTFMSFSSCSEKNFIIL